MKSMIFAHFKANQGLSYSDVVRFFGCTIDDAREWSNGHCPQHIEQALLIANNMLEHRKTNDLNDIDAQNWQHRAETLEREIRQLKIQLGQYVKTPTYGHINYSERDQHC